MLSAQGVPREETEQCDHAYALEVWVWADLVGESAEPDRADVIEGPLKWVPLAEVEKEPVFPKELKALARDLAEGRARVGVPVFTSGLGDPWDEPEWGSFREAM